MNELTTRAAKRAVTSGKIIEAAQREFGERGFDATTVRAIAKRAGVDPSLVIQHYGSKDDLFRIATQLPSELFAIAVQLPADTPPAEVAEHLVDVLAVRMGTPSPQVRALIRSMLTAPAATTAMKAYLEERVSNLARATNDPDAELRAALAVSSILGLTIARHFLELSPLATMSPEQLNDVALPWLTSLLNTDDSRTSSRPT